MSSKRREFPAVGQAGLLAIKQAVAAMAAFDVQVLERRTSCRPQSGKSTSPAAQMHPEQIKAAMRIAGTTPAMLCDELGVAASSVSQAISGHIKSQRIQGRIAQIIGKPVTEIWPNQVTLRRSRAQIEAQRARATA